MSIRKSLKARKKLEAWRLYTGRGLHMYYDHHKNRYCEPGRNRRPAKLTRSDAKRADSYENYRKPGQQQREGFRRFMIAVRAKDKHFIQELIRTTRNWPDCLNGGAW